MERMKCQNCQIRILDKKRYRCCNKLADVCLECSFQTCRQCLLKKQSDKKSYQGAYRSSSYKCSICKEILSILSQSFKDDKCGYEFCSRCIHECYLRHLRVIAQVTQAEGVKPELGIDLPCGCQLNQQVIIKFLRKVCIHCFKKINVSCYELSNGTLINKSCYDWLDKSVTASFRSSSSEKKLHNILKKLIMECSSCGQTISELGSRVDGINVCKFCLQQMTMTESAYERKKSQSLEQEKREKERKKEKEIKRVDKICKKCFTPFVTEDRGQQSSRFCIKCLNQEEVLKVSLESNKKQKKEEKNDSLKKQKEGKGKEQTEVLGDIKVNDLFPQKQIIKDLWKKQKILEKEEKEEQKPLLDSQSTQVNDYPLEDTGSIIKINEGQKIIKKHEKQGMKEHQINEEKFEVRFSYENCLFEQKNQCCTCLIFFKLDQLMTTFQKEEGNKMTIRIAETEEELKKYEENKNLKYYCQLCYITLKNKLKESSQQEKIPAHRSVPKKEPSPKVNFQYTNIFSPYERQNWTDKKKPTKDRGSLLENQRKFFRVKCKLCKTEFLIEKDKIKPDIFCLKCQKSPNLLKGSKQTSTSKKCLGCDTNDQTLVEMGRNGYCLRCKIKMEKR